MKKNPEVRIENRKARFDYAFLETWTAGIILVGSEVKSIREGRVSLVDTFCTFVQYELWVHDMVISSIRDGMHNPNVSRKILLKRKELKKLEKSMRDGMTIIVSKLFSVNGRIKAEIVLAKGKNNYDKRETIKARDISRETKQGNC